MTADFVDRFRRLLMTEFDCSEREADRIAKHAERHRRNTGVERTPEEWIAVMTESEADTAVQRWKAAVASDTEIDRQ